MSEASRKGGIVGAGLVPGLPHLLASKPAAGWTQLAEATRALGRELRAAGAESLMLVSSQWFSVLGLLVHAHTDNQNLLMQVSCAAALSLAALSCDLATVLHCCTMQHAPWACVQHARCNNMGVCSTCNMGASCAHAAAAGQPAAHTV